MVTLFTSLPDLSVVFFSLFCLFVFVVCLVLFLLVAAAFLANKDVYIARVHPVHLMNVKRRQAAADPRPSKTT